MTGTTAESIYNHGSQQSWKVLEFEKSPGKSWNFTEIWKISGKVLEFFSGQTVQKRDFWVYTSIFQASLFVESGSSLINWRDFHLKYIGCSNNYMYSAHHWMMIFKFVIKSLILEPRNCMSNPSATVSVLFDSSPFRTC